MAIAQVWLCARPRSSYLLFKSSFDLNKSSVTEKTRIDIVWVKRLRVPCHWVIRWP